MSVRLRDLALALAVSFWPLALLSLFDASFNNVKFRCLCHVDGPIRMAGWLVIGMAPAIVLACGPRILRVVAAIMWTGMSLSLVVIAVRIFVADPLVADAGWWLAVSAVALVLGGTLAVLASVRGRE